MDYDRLERSDRAPKRVVDHSAAWAKLEPVGAVNGQTEQRIKQFCETKQITVDGARGARRAGRAPRGGKVELAFAGTTAQARSPRSSTGPLGRHLARVDAEQPSTWLRPIVVGNRDSLDWFVAEGETDAARLWELVGDVAAILVLPAGARTFKPRMGRR